MVIVAGQLQVAPDRREEYLGACHEIVEQARETAGCLDFALSPDPVDPGRINVFERWDTAAAVDLFRGEAPGGPDTVPLLGARVEQFEVTDARRL